VCIEQFSLELGFYTQLGSWLSGSPRVTHSTVAQLRANATPYCTVHCTLPKNDSTLVLDTLKILKQINHNALL